MPLVAQREVMADLTVLALYIPEVYSAVAADALAAGQKETEAAADAKAENERVATAS